MYSHLFWFILYNIFYIFFRETLFLTVFIPHLIYSSSLLGFWLCPWKASLMSFAVSLQTDFFLVFFKLQYLSSNFILQNFHREQWVTTGAAMILINICNLKRCQENAQYCANLEASWNWNMKSKSYQLLWTWECYPAWEISAQLVHSQKHYWEASNSITWAAMQYIHLY